MRWVVPFIHFLWFAAILPSVSGLVLTRRDDDTNEVEWNILRYLASYEGPNEDDLQGVRGRSPSVQYVSSQAVDASVKNYYSIGQEFQTTPLVADDFAVDMDVLENLQDQAKYKIFTWDNAQDDCEAFILYTTYGMWVFKFRVSAGQDIMNEYDKEREAKGNPRYFRVTASRVFQERIQTPYIDETSRASPKSLRKFIEQVQEKGGTFTRISMIQHTPVGKKTPTNGKLFTALLEWVHRITKAERYQKTARWSEPNRLPWATNAAPFESEESRKMILSFAFQQSRWTGIAMYGPALASFWRSDIANNDHNDEDCQVIEDVDEIMDDAEPLDVEVDAPGSSKTILWADKSNNEMKYDRASSNAPDVLVVLLTTKGHWSLNYPASAFQSAVKAVTLHEIQMKLQKGIKSLEKKNAQSLDIITLVSTDPQTGYIYGASYLREVLKIIQKGTAPLGGGDALNRVTLIHPTPAGVMADAHLFLLKSAKAPKVYDVENKGQTFEILYDNAIQMSMIFGDGSGGPKVGVSLGEKSSIDDIIHLRATGS
ncbi:uncharacterized protein N7459_007879 [Penicillium hispanicum]|uniref:uncharacterized protein n=1 Tax=Penicillium hispanicum TaxID=1080232 RepID=UPI0025406BC4|nr:uncharacterized protein N7459_007879 [Penicillium hispanicum]KAJ5573452.1 hypothetical protein N7459_007879 [Penicillium hispanicum]